MHLILLIEDTEEHEHLKSGQVVTLSGGFEFTPVLRQDTKSTEIVQGVNVVKAMSSSYGVGTSKSIDNLSEQSRVAATAAHALVNNYPVLWDTTKWIYEADLYLPDDLPAPIKGQSAGLAYALYQLEQMAGFYEAGSLPRFPSLTRRFGNTLIAATGALDPVGQVLPVEGVEAKFRGLLEWLKGDDPRQQFDELVCLYPADLGRTLSTELMTDFEATCIETRFIAVNTLAEAVEAIAPDELPIPSTDISPYRGLNKFTLEHSALFFGREDTVQEAIIALEAYQQSGAPNQHAIIFGDSGTGKSSFVEAGILPHWCKDLQPIVIRPGDCGGDPLKELIEQLDNLLTAEGKQLDWHNDIVGSVDRCLCSINAQRLVIVIDQAEELVVSDLEKAKVQIFLSVISALGGWTCQNRNKGLDTWVLSSIRTSEYENYLTLLKLQHERNEFFAFQLQKLDARSHTESYQRIIETPARANGIKVNTAFTTHLLSVLAELEDPLPHLQYALDEFYRHLMREKQLNEGFTIDQYQEAIGSIGNLLTNRADSLYERFEEQNEERYLYPFFDELLGIDPKNGTVYQTPCDISAFKKPSLRKILNQFRDERLVTEARYSVRFTHETLIRTWEVIAIWAALRAARARKKVMYSLASGLALASVLVGVSGYSALTALESQHMAESELKKSVAANLGNFSNQQLNLENTDYGKGAAAALAAYRLDPSPPHLRNLFEYTLVSHNLPERVVQAHSERIENLTFWADNRSFATFSKNDGIKFWDASTFEEFSHLKSKSASDELAVHPFFPIFVIAIHNELYLYTVDDKTTDPSFVKLPKFHKLKVTSIEFSKDGSAFLSTSADRVQLWNFKGAPLSHVSTTMNELIYSASFDPASNNFAYADSRNLVVNVDRNGSILSVFDGAPDLVESISFQSQGKYIAAGGVGGVSIWRTSDRTRHDIKKFEAYAISKTVKFNPEGSQLAVAYGARIDFFDSNTLSEIFSLNASQTVTDFEFDPDRSTLVAAQSDGKVVSWQANSEIIWPKIDVVNDLADYKNKPTKLLESGSLNDLMSQLASSREPLEMGSILKRLKAENPRHDIKLSPDGEKLAIFTSQLELILYDLKENRITSKKRFGTSNYGAIKPSNLFVNSLLSYSKDSRKLALVRPDNNSVAVLDTNSGELASAPIKMGGVTSISNLTFNFDGEKIAALGKNLLEHRIYIFDFNEGEFSLNAPLSEFIEDQNNFIDIAFHPYADTLGIFDIDGVSLLSDSNKITRKKLELKDLEAHKISFSNTGKYLTASHKGIIVLDYENSEILLRSPSSTEFAFSSDDRFLVTINDDDGIQLWEVFTNTLIGEKKARVSKEIVGVSFSSNDQLIMTIDQVYQRAVWPSPYTWIDILCEYDNVYLSSVSSVIHVPDSISMNNPCLERDPR